jgi:hypothetical protein
MKGAHHLENYGWVVVDVRHVIGPNRFEKMLRSFPEYRNDLPLRDTLYVKGGFGALANPSSYHHPYVRSIRENIMREAVPLFAQLSDDDDFLEQLFGRVRVLKWDAKIQPESWHRDLTPKWAMLPTDRIYGGWVNLDTHGITQYFSCVSKTHNVRQYGGFSKTENDSAATRVEIPPGHMLIFSQDLIHEVVGGTRKRQHDEYRLFTAWRLTKSTKRFMPGDLDIFTYKTVPLLKSGQRAPMYPTTGNWRGTLKMTQNAEKWAKQTFLPELLETRVKESGPNQGASFLLPPQYFYSLYHVALRLEARRVLDNLEDIGYYQDDVYENVLCALDEITEIIAYEPVDQWPTPLPTRDEFERAGFDFGNIDQVMGAPYSESEIAVMSPNRQWRLSDGTLLTLC